MVDSTLSSFAIRGNKRTETEEEEDDEKDDDDGVISLNKGYFLLILQSLSCARERYSRVVPSRQAPVEYVPRYIKAKSDSRSLRFPQASYPDYKESAVRRTVNGGQST